MFGRKKTIEFATYTDVGSRNVNEDSVKAISKGGMYCFVLCDGLGGHGMGDAASRLVTDVFDNCFGKTGSIDKFLPTAFSAGQDLLMEEQKRLNAEKKMKTTAVAAALDGKKAYIGHVGDSRAYVFSEGKVLKRTLDHSIPQMLVLSHEIDEKAIRNHPDRNIVLRVMGVEWEKPQYELMAPISLRKCAAFLLCSDGFWELIEEEEMCGMLKESANAREWLDRMADRVKQNGAGRDMDNNSAIAVWCR